jgi:hypothetical protein
MSPYVTLVAVAHGDHQRVGQRVRLAPKWMSAEPRPSMNARAVRRGLLSPSMYGIVFKVCCVTLYASSVTPGWSVSMRLA